MLIDKWGRYAWFESKGIDKIHPEDVDSFKKVSSNVKVFHAIKEEGGYLYLRYGDLEYRVNPDLFREVQRPEFFINELVYVDDSKEAIVCENMWHHSQREHYYLVTVNGKKKSKRYFESEIKKISL